MSESQGANAGMDSSDSTTKPAKGGPSRGLLIGGLVAIVVIAGVILTTNNSDAPRSGTATCATTSQGCAIGDIGPGGGKVYSLGGATTSPADCTQFDCLEVAPATWAGTADPGVNWATAKSRVAAYSPSQTAPAGSWRLPNQAELITLAAQPNTLSGFDLRTYWSSTATTTYDRQNEVTVAGAYCRTISTVGSCPQTFANVYARPIHTF
jgi:hypothetical protein